MNSILRELKLFLYVTQAHIYYITMYLLKGNKRSFSFYTYIFITINLFCGIYVEQCNLIKIPMFRFCSLKMIRKL